MLSEESFLLEKNICFLKCCFFLKECTRQWFWEWWFATKHNPSSQWNLLCFVYRGHGSGWEKMASIFQVLSIPVQRASWSSGQTMVRWAHVDGFPTCSASEGCPARAHECSLLPSLPPPHTVNVFFQVGKTKSWKECRTYTLSVWGRCNKTPQTERTKCSNRTGQKSAPLGWFLGILLKKQTYKVQAIWEKLQNYGYLRIGFLTAFPWNSCMSYSVGNTGLPVAM